MELIAAETMARELMRKHMPMSHDYWRFEWDNAKRRNGLCNHHDQIISLSRPLTQLRTEAAVRNTILHEIAHALVGSGHGHDRTWQRMARALGCSGERCSGDGVKLPGKYIGTCAAGHSFHRHRVPRGNRVQSCAHCCPYFSKEHLITWRLA